MIGHGFQIMEHGDSLATYLFAAAVGIAFGAILEILRRSSRG